MVTAPEAHGKCSSLCSGSNIHRGWSGAEHQVFSGSVLTHLKGSAPLEAVLNGFGGRRHLLTQQRGHQNSGEPYIRIKLVLEVHSDPCPIWISPDKQVHLVTTETGHDLPAVLILEPAA